MLSKREVYSFNFHLGFNQFAEAVFQFCVPWDGRLFPIKRILINIVLFTMPHKEASVFNEISDEILSFQIATSISLDLRSDLFNVGSVSIISS